MVEEDDVVSILQLNVSLLYALSGRRGREVEVVLGNEGEEGGSIGRGTTV